MGVPKFFVRATLNAAGALVVLPPSMEYPMDVAGTPAQVVVLAASVNGAVTLAPFAGLLTVMSDPVLVAGGGVGGGAVAAATVMFRFVWLLACLPQHFTLSTCGPALAVTLALNEVGSATVAPLSME